MTELISEAEANRIINHMNNDHASSLSHYLEHFGQISNPYNPKISIYNSNQMILEFGKLNSRKIWELKFDPPMMAGQSRKRLEELHNDARTGLGLSAVTINSFRLNDFGTILALTILSILLIGISLTPNELLVSYTPFIAKFVIKGLNVLGISNSTSIDVIGIAEKVFLVGGLVFIHFIEAVIMLPGLFYKYNTTSFLVKTQYFLATIIAGFHIWKSLRTLGEEGENLLSAKNVEKKH